MIPFTAGPCAMPENRELALNTDRLAIGAHTTIFIGDASLDGDRAC
jgi:hypothetical protein